MQVLQNQLQRFVGEAASTSGAATALAVGIKTLGENIPTIANALAALALILAGRYTASVLVGTAANITYTASLIAKTAAIYGVSRAAAAGAVSMRGLSASMAFFGGPIGLAITGVALAVWGVYEATKAAAQADLEHKSAADQVAASVEAYGKAADAAAGASGRERTALIETAKAARTAAAADREATAAKLGKARATLAAMQAAAMEKIHSGTLDPEGAGMQIAAMGLTESKLMSNVKALVDALAKADADIRAIETRMRALTAPPGAPPGSGSTGAATRSGAAPKDKYVAVAVVEEVTIDPDTIWDAMAAQEIDQNPDRFKAAGQNMPGAVVNGRVLSPEDLAQAKEDFRDTFSGGIMAALLDGRDGFARWFQQGAERGLEKALDRLSDLIFDLFAQAGQSGGEGGGWLSTIGSVITGAFGGARAYGGPVDAGGSYLVGERGPERFVPGVSGLIMPAPRVGIAGAGANGGRGSVMVRVSSDDEKFRAYVEGISGNVAAQGDANVIGASVADRQRSAMKQKYKARR
jgi:hypothetical protein